MRKAHNMTFCISKRFHIFGGSNLKVSWQMNIVKFFKAICHVWANAQLHIGDSKL
jgi:hypothetical protein